MNSFADHLTAFVDLLGFKNAMAAEADRIQILNLLKALAYHKGNFAITPYGSEKAQAFRIRPSVTSFSDNIVISYSLSEMIENKVPLEVAGLFLSTMVGFVAWKALTAGFLIRGGVALGELHHADGIVAGRAMIDAYLLESSVAGYPRVICSNELINHPTFGNMQRTFKDHDGIHCLHYMDHVIFRSDPGEKPFLEIERWVRDLRKLCGDNLAKFEAAGDLRRLSKWTWLSNYLERTIAQLGPELTGATAK